MNTQEKFNISHLLNCCFNFSLTYTYNIEINSSHILRIKVLKLAFNTFVYLTRTTSTSTMHTFYNSTLKNKTKLNMLINVIKHFKLLKITSSNLDFGTLHIQLVPKFVSLVCIQRRQHRFS